MPTPAPTHTRWTAPRGLFPQPPAPPRPDGLAAVYRRRDPTATPLYPLVQHHLETFLAETTAADPDGYGVPQWVEDNFRAYLRCGILAHGFARIRCDACAAERLVAFSCKGRGVCPSCNARRMVEVAAHLTDHVLPPLPLRQWVFSLPKRIRPFLPMTRAWPVTCCESCSGASAPRSAAPARPLRATPSSAPRERVISLGRHYGEAPGEMASAAGHDLPPGTGTATAGSDEADMPDSPQRAAARSRWARLLARIYEVFPLTCPACGADMRTLAFITTAEPVDAVLTHLTSPPTPASIG
jgi:hypothetical protein